MAKTIVFVSLVALAVRVSAQIPNLGWCPDYLPMAEFDLNQFLGKWYEQERYFTFSEVASRCVVTDYAKAPSGRIYVSNEVTNRLTGVKRVIGGNLELVGKAGEGKLNVKYATTPIATETTLTVLHTDYDDFAVIWSCNGFGPVNTQSAWVMTRDRLPSGNTMQKAYGLLDKFKISRTFFVKTDQEGCAVAASDINAANGITPTSTVPESIGVEQKQAPFEGAAKSAAAAPKEKEKLAPKAEEKKVEEVKPLPVAKIVMNLAEAQKTPAAELSKPVADEPQAIVQNLPAQQPELPLKANDTQSQSQSQLNQNAKKDA